MGNLTTRARLATATHIQLAGLNADPDRLYDGTMLRITTEWWNRVLAHNKAFQHPDFLAFDATSQARLQRTVDERNRHALEAVADKVAVGGRLGTAALALSYAFARTFEAGATTAAFDATSPIWQRPRLLTAEVLDFVSTSYSFVADD